MLVSNVPSQSRGPVLVTTHRSVSLHCGGSEGDKVIELTSLPNIPGMQDLNAIVKFPDDSEKFQIILSQTGQPWRSFQDARNDSSTAVVERDKRMLKTLPRRNIDKLIINPTPDAVGTIREAKNLEPLGIAPSNWSSRGPAHRLQSRLSPPILGPTPARKRQREHSPNDDDLGREPGHFQITRER